jgi:hypothetical protein
MNRIPERADDLYEDSLYAAYEDEYEMRPDPTWDDIILEMTPEAREGLVLSLGNICREDFPKYRIVEGVCQEVDRDHQYENWLQGLIEAFAARNFCEIGKLIYERGLNRWCEEDLSGMLEDANFKGNLTCKHQAGDVYSSLVRGS